MATDAAKLANIDELSVQTIRLLAAEGVQAAKSGHPGMPMGMASAAYTLWTKYLRYNPQNPNWLNRDRFVLSAGHGSMLLYSMLHLTGYDLPLEELKNFRQLGSKTPGHPEYGVTPGVEVTTGPLGQGIANAVGMAIASKHLAAKFNKPGLNVIDYNVYAICGDGCLQEGISSEACSLAGHLGLGNLILIYDDNHITIDGNTSLSFTEDRAKRFEAYNWHVQVVDGDGNDRDAIEKALNAALAQTDKPSIIQLRSCIGFGSPNFQGTHTIHGTPVGDDEIKLMKKNYGWDPEKAFHVPSEVKEHMGQAVERGSELENKWNDMFKSYSQSNPDLAKQFTTAAEDKCPVDIDKLLPTFEVGKSIATRQASGKCLNCLMPKIELVMGGSADLTPSNNTHFDGAVDFQKDTPEGRYIRYGVREHAMGAIMNGITTTGLLKAYSATFMVFSDYMRPAIRVAAISKHNTIFVFTHDSIGVGEDGPTHQPVEHIAALRDIPDLTVIRPADANETAQTWKYALTQNEGPVVLMFSRQGMPVLDQEKYAPACNLTKGAYTLLAADKPDVLLLATGSEVAIALDAAGKLAEQNIAASVVSMPSWELFEKQDQAYKDSVLPPSVKARVGIEAGVRGGWDRWIGDNGIFIGMSSFGVSAPAGTCYKKFGITADATVAAAKKSISGLA